MLTGSIIPTKVCIMHRKCGHYSSVGVVDGLWVSGHGGYRVHTQCKDCRKWEESFCFAPPNMIVWPLLRRVVVVLQQPGHCTFLQTTDVLVLYAFTHMNISTIRVMACFILHVIWPNFLVMRWRGWRWWWDTLAQLLRSKDATILDHFNQPTSKWGHFSDCLDIL